jgi:hypothetical protein
MKIKQIIVLSLFFSVLGACKQAKKQVNIDVVKQDKAKEAYDLRLSELTQ